MKKLIAAVREKFAHDPLAATYYALAIVVFVGSGMGYVARLINLEIAAYAGSVVGIFIGGALLLIPALVRRQPPAVLNPNLEIVTSVYEAAVSKNRMRIERQHRLRATRPVQRYTFLIRPTGKSVLSVQLRSLGRLHGPLVVRDKTRYDIEFPAILRKGETYDLSFVLELNEPTGDIKPYFSISGVAAATIGEVSVSCRFENQQPASVQYEECDAATTNPRGQRADLLPDDAGRYLLRLDRIKTGDLHVLSWVW